MGSYSQLVSLAQNAVALFAAGAFALLGGCTALVGALVINASGWMARRLYLRQLLRDLMAWGAMVAYSNPAEVVGLTERFTKLVGWLLLGAGLGMVVASSALALLTPSVTGLSLGIMAEVELGGALVYYGFALGATIGHLAGTYALTRVADGPAWADLRRRRASDYRAGWLAWGTFAMAGVTILPLAAMLIFQSRTPAGAVDATFATSPPWPVPVIVAVMVWTLLIPTLGALLCRWIAASPRALTFTDPQVARAADEMRRAISIGLVTSLTWASGGLTLVGVAFGAVFMLITSLGPTASPLLPLVVLGILILLILLILLGMLAFAFGLILNALRGRLGGRLAGARPSLRVFLAEMTPL